MRQNRGYAVYFGYYDDFHYKGWERELVSLIREWLLRSDEHAISWVEDPENADIVVAIEPNAPMFRRDIERLKKQRLITQFPERIYCLNTSANASGFLPGVYTSVEAPRFNASLHRNWCYTYPANTGIEQVEEISHEPELDFSFRGAESHVCRRRLFEIFSKPLQNASIKKIDRWFDHTEQEKDSYCKEIQNSKFVLCPRGIASSSHRLFEVMALRRCPIVISDAWIRPNYVDWESFALFCPEAEIERIPHIIEKHKDEWRERGQIARKNWETYFSPGNRLIWALQNIIDLQEGRDIRCDVTSLFNRWDSLRFLHANGWLLYQRLIRKAQKMFVVQ